MKQLYVIEEGHLNVLAKLAKRLFTEQRMNGDEMRDGAQALSGIIATCLQVEIPPDAPRQST